MAYTVVSGCSVTAGVELDQEKNDPQLWVNILHQQNKFISQTELINLASVGESNTNIFLTVLDAILNRENIKYVIVQWTNGPRYTINAGLELYDTKIFFGLHHEDTWRNHNLNDITFPAKWLIDLNKRLLSLPHPHYEILSIIKYTNLLINLAKLKNIEIFFLAAPVLWDTDYFTRIDLAKHFDINLLTPNTQKFLNVHNRDDDEILKLYNKMHNDYDQAGGMHAEHWCTLGCYTDDYNPKVSVLAQGHWKPEIHHNFAKLCSDKINATLLK